MYSTIDSWLDTYELEKESGLNREDLSSGIYKPEQILSKIQPILNKRTLKEEKQIGLKPDFKYISKEWFPHYIKTQMKRSKKFSRIKNPWMGYFVLGNFQKNSSCCSSRFWPNSPLYQAWFGVYLLKEIDSKPFGFKNGKPILNELLNAGISDQMSWLSKYYVKDPVCLPFAFNPNKSIKFQVSNNTGYLWKGKFLTQSDFNLKGSNDWRYNLLFGKPNKLFVNINQEHHHIILDGFYSAGFLEQKKVTWIIYGVGSHHYNDKNDEVNNFDNLRESMVEMVKNLKLVEV